MLYYLITSIDLHINRTFMDNDMSKQKDDDDYGDDVGWEKKSHIK